MVHGTTTPVTRVTPLLRAVLLGLLLLGLGWLLLRLRAALTPVLFALLVSYALDPLVDQLETRGMPRSIGIAFVLAMVILLLLLFVFLVLPSVVSDLAPDEATIVDVITNSRSGVMPAWTGRLDPVTIKSLAYYVHSLGGGEK